MGDIDDGGPGAEVFLTLSAAVVLVLGVASVALYWRKIAGRSSGGTEEVRNLRAMAEEALADRDALKDEVDALRRQAEKAKLVERRMREAENERDMFRSQADQAYLITNAQWKELEELREQLRRGGGGTPRGGSKEPNGLEGSGLMQDLDAAVEELRGLDED